MTENSVQDKRLRIILLRSVLIGGVLGLVISLSIVSIAPGLAYEVLRLETGSPVIGTSNVTVACNNRTSSDIVDLLRTNDFSPENGWIFYSVMDSSVSEITYVRDSAGIQVSGRESSLTMYRHVNILIDDYDSVVFSFNARSITGAMRCSIRVMFWEGWHELASFKRSMEWSEGMNGTLIYDISEGALSPLELVRPETMHWIIDVMFEIQVEFTEAGMVLISDARIHASAKQPLVPVIIDLRDLDNATIFGGTRCRPVFEPFANVSSGSHDHYSFLMIHLNECVFLPAGEYVLDYGWFGWNIRSEFWRQGSFLLNVTVDSELLVTIRTRVLWLSIEWTPEIPLRLEFHNFGGLVCESELLARLDILSSSSLCFPAEYGPIMMSIVVWVPYRFSIITNLTIGANHLRVTAAFPVFVFMGFGFDTVQSILVVIVAAVLIASLISLTRSAAPIPISIREILRRERSRYALLLAASYFLPWNSSVQLWPGMGYPDLVHVVYTYYPFLGLIATSIQGTTFLSTVADLQSHLFLFVVLWLPLLYMIRQSIHDVPLEMNLCTLLPPAVPGILGLIDILSSKYIGPGSVLALIAFMTVILATIHKWYQKRITNNTKKAREHEVEEKQAANNP